MYVGLRTDGTHAVVETTRPETALRDLEAATLPEQHIADRHSHVPAHVATA